MYTTNCDISDLKGKTLVEITGAEVGSEEIIFTTSEGKKYKMWYEPDCCASCNIDDICGEIETLLNTPIIEAYESSNHSDPPKKDSYGSDPSYTWTFYVIRTNLGTVTIKWYGSSNGYYSESVSFAKTK